ncbi:MAG: ASPIC/UnbV domain-containing protein, partial [Verrucomicrobiota bacterium]|nr:ASPIC/UnbV domain-containing protein [Verrucomicrobiota bacterium]
LMTAGRFFVNDCDNKNHWLKVHLKSEKKKVNRHAIGAQARVTLKDGKVLSRQVESGTGQGNQNDLVLHFGLGSNDRPVDLDIFWPDGSTQNIKEVQIDQKLEFKIKD